LWFLDLSDNYMSGSLPSSIGRLVWLEVFFLSMDGGTNMFFGPLPDSMRNLVLLEELFLNVKTLAGPMPDFRGLTSLWYCAFVPSQLCRIPEFVPMDSKCDFSVLPVCKDLVPDCAILAEWLPKLFDQYSCCQADGVTCEEDRIVILDISRGMTGEFIYGGIPTKIGGWNQLQELYLQGNILEGNFPISLANISSLKVVDITNNYLSGVLIFVPNFELIGIDSNLDLSLPYIKSTASVKETQLVENPRTDSVSDTIVGVIGVAVFLVTAIAFATGLYFYHRRAKRRREDTSYTPSDDWSDGIPMSSVSGSGMYFTDEEIPKDANGLVFKCLISTGGFGQVWKVFKLFSIARECIRNRQSQ
jgi:hypothetical protein